MAGMGAGYIFSRRRGVHDPQIRQTGVFQPWDTAIAKQGMGDTSCYFFGMIFF